MRHLLAALVVLASCAAAPVPPPKACKTPCGLSYEGDCSELAKAEAKIVDAYATKAPEFGDRKAVCSALGGWKVEIRLQKPEDRKICGDTGWLEIFLCVIGYTEVTDHTVTLASDKFRKNSLAHEIGHVLSIQSGVGSGHCMWKERGILDAIETVTGKPSRAEPEDACVGKRYVPRLVESPDGGS